MTGLCVRMHLRCGSFSCRYNNFLHCGLCILLLFLVCNFRFYVTDFMGGATGGVGGHCSPTFGTRVVQGGTMKIVPATFGTRGTGRYNENDLSGD